MPILIPPPPIDTAPFLGKSNIFSSPWQRWYLSLVRAFQIAVAPGDATYLLAKASATLLNAINLGALASGYIKIVVAAGIATVSSVSSIPRTSSIGIVIDGGGALITNGIKGDLSMPVAGTIQSVTMLADQVGSIVVDIWKDTYANYPPTGADSITASAKPTITTAVKSQDLTLTGWTTAIAAGDTLRFNVDSATAVTRLTLSLTVLVP